MELFGKKEANDKLPMDMEEVKNVMKDKFEERFHVKLKTGTLSKMEKELTKNFLLKYYSPEWVYR